MLRSLPRIALLWALALATVWLGDRIYRDHVLTGAEPRTISPRADLTAMEQSVVALFENAGPSVAYIFTETVRSTGFMRREVGTGAGSGFIWDRVGHVVTNNHVIEGAEKVYVQLNTGKPIPAQVIGRAPSYDLAVVRLAELPATARPIPVGSSSNLKVGQTTFAIGNPFGLSKTLTQGIVSALDRNLPTSNRREISGVIQTDAAINPGNSGGPLLDSAGRLIGVNTAILSESGSSAGVGFAIPVDLVNRIVPELIKRGKAPQPGIGISAADEAAAQLGVTGVVVLGVAPGLPAAEAGLRPLDARTGTLGDVIVEVEGEPTPTVSRLVAALEKAGIGATVKLKILRSGRDEITMSVKVIDIS